MTIRDAIRAAVKQQGMTQTELEARTGILQHTLSNYLNAKKDMNGASLDRLLQALGLRLVPSRKRKG